MAPKMGAEMFLAEKGEHFPQTIWPPPGENGDVSFSECRTYLRWGARRFGARGDQLREEAAFAAHETSAANGAVLCLKGLDLSFERKFEATSTIPAKECTSWGTETVVGA